MSSATGNASSSDASTAAAESKKHKEFRMHVGEISLELPRIGQLQPLYAFNMDVATRRSARQIAHDRLHVTGFPRVVGMEPDAEMVESARRSCSARGYTTRHSASDSNRVKGAEWESTADKKVFASKAEAEQAKLRSELSQIGGGGGFNLSLLSSSRYYHGAQSTCSGVSDVARQSPRNMARAKIQQQSQLPYGREAFDGISDTADSLYSADYCRRYAINDKARYVSSIEVLTDGNRHQKHLPDPKFLSQTPRGRATMLQCMTTRPKQDKSAISGGYI